MEAPKMTDPSMFFNHLHQSVLVEALSNMYTVKELVDITLCVQEREFDCHRNILAASSPYFHAMFTTNLNEKGKSKVVLHDIDPQSLALVIEYCYTGKVEINKLNAQNLLAAASLFQINPVQEACAKFMETQLDESNCIGIHQFADIHNCSELKIKAREFIEKNFTEVCVGEEFLELTPDQLAEIIESSELNVEKEEIVFDSLLAWLNHDKESRLKTIDKILPHIRFGLLSPKYVEEIVINNRLLSESQSCAKILEDLQHFESSPEYYRGDYTFSMVLRSGMIKPERCILLIGGTDNRLSINCYNPLTRETYSLPYFADSEKMMSGYYEVEDPSCVVTEENQIFVAGGNYIFHESFGESQSDDSYDDYEGTESVHKNLYLFDNDHNTWIEKAPMLFPKSNFTLAAVEGRLYCFGGLTVNQHPTEIIESYDIALNRWNYVGMMPTTLVDLSSVVHNNQIYILGGRTGVGAHNFVMRFDPKQTEWTSLAGMPTPRFNFGACVVDDEIYVAGGQIYSHTSHSISRESLSSVEIYDMDKNQWRQGPELPESMYDVGLFSTNGALYAFGTTEVQRSQYRFYRYNVLYRYDNTMTGWVHIESDLSDVRDFACVMAKLHTRKLSKVFRPEVDT